MQPRILIRRHGRDGPWDYRRLDGEQRRVAEAAREGAPGAILLSELAPVITLGRRAGPGELLVPLERLSELGIGLLATDRGGLATYHGPGQWVLFCIDRLERLTGDPRGVRRAVEGLLRIALLAAREREPRAEARGGAELGVWTPLGKVASVGVHVQRGVLLHGLALNVFRTPTSFAGLRPCGLDLPVDFLLPASEEAAFASVGETLVRLAQEVFW